MTRAESAETAAIRQMAERERLADERELLADQRDDVADQRELLADERERVADQLDGLAPPGEAPPASSATGSQLRLLESARGLQTAHLALDRSRATLAKRQVAVSQEDNAARQEDLTVAREMLATRVADAQRTHAETP